MTGSPNSTGRFAFPLFSLLDGLEQLSYETTSDATLDSGAVQAGSATALRLDRLFDIFPESYWGRYTSLTEIALTATLTGKARIEIRRRNALTGEEQALAEVDCEGKAQPIAIPIVLQQPGSDEDASYLIAVLHLSAGAGLRNLHWSAATPGVRDVRIAGVICTFNQEEMLADNLAQISAAPAFLHRLFVINQGPPGLEKRIISRGGSQTLFTFIDQANFGGAGGFTRGIIESLDDPQVTHILLMDDDIKAQPLLLARIATILAYAGERHCIGGAMLDIHAPTKLFTCGDQINPGRPAIINIAPPEGCEDVTTDAGRDFVALNHKPDFNGWWCFAFPVAAVRQCGLPLPLFIRGDDVEFGFRLSRAGFPTIVWPGVAVWHLPFQPKVQPWQAFYDRRNMLFLNEAHGLFSRRRLARSAWGSFANAIRGGDFARARAIVEGVEAFNKGPSHLASWSGEDHSALVGRMARDHSWRSIIILSACALSAIVTLRWRRRSNPDAINRLSSAGFWRDYLSISSPANAPSHDKGFASHPDDGIAPSQQIQATSVKSCDPI
ncbi:putative glycosyltransferase [Sphingobium herbicidovorans NBRC 16415]|uniref:Glycosyltransferase n=1 Tax=Sphingobium herbicidovorans (strain ATCC 700291 / DSM 11019 / CCUG 56400 / KCTC 2939 / LMG 18315 / NBRC 16415 / MH) TaxID=1219045 RepID=A0A086PEC9_SPHHM|nr:glycosyltransferase [Sphingobium herbicidovorans]KFG91747.1 putative glycosyltransferase [Sphingobium herbicidovorans NBRC 16415]